MTSGGDDEPDATALLDADGPAAAVERLIAQPADVRATVARDLRALADDRPAETAPMVPALEPLLTDPERPVRLATVKTIVPAAAHDPDAAVERLRAPDADGECPNCGLAVDEGVPICPRCGIPC
jgi:hypothetical protein